MFIKIKPVKWSVISFLIMIAVFLYVANPLQADIETKTDAFSSAGGKVASANYENIFILGQASPPSLSESIHFTNIGGFLAPFGIIQYEQVVYDFPVPEGGWYLISLPVIPTSTELGNLFPDALAAYGWDMSSQEYTVATALEPEKGYWLAMPFATTVEVWGQPLNSYSRSYNENRGWDLTGTIYNPTPLVDDPDGSVVAIFKWDADARAYVLILSDQPLQPKDGIWIGVYDIPCTISLNPTSMMLAGLTKGNNKFAGRAFTSEYGSSPPMPPSFAIRDGELTAIPDEYDLKYSYPNPFNPVTMIEYQLPQEGQVSLKIYSILGQEVRTLVDDKQHAGFYKVAWNGENNIGQKLSSGVYIYQLIVGDFVRTKKTTLIK
jgi:hypothetical protein